MKRVDAGQSGMNPHELIKKLVTEAGAEGGSIFLDDFCDQCSGVPRAECVAALKNNKDVLFVVGRKGHMSRAVFGRMKEHYGEAPSFKSPLASGPIRHHTFRRLTSQRMVASGADLDPTQFRLRVVVQGQEVFVPVDEIELVPTK